MADRRELPPTSRRAPRWGDAPLGGGRRDRRKGKIHDIMGVARREKRGAGRHTAVGGVPASRSGEEKRKGKKSKNDRAHSGKRWQKGGSKKETAGGRVSRGETRLRGQRGGARSEGEEGDRARVDESWEGLEAAEIVP